MSSTSIYNSSIVNISKEKESVYLFTFSAEVDDLFFTSLYIDKFITDTTETDTHIQYTLHLDSVQTLPLLLVHHKQRLSYQLSKFLLLTLGEQLSYLERNKKTFLSIDPQHIIVLNEQFFLCMEPKGIYAISEDDNVVIDTPPKKSPFFSPELATIKSIPSTVHKNSWMYSIASMVGFYLTNNMADSESDETHIFFSKLLESIQDTPLYFCLLRCGVYNPLKRAFLYI